MSRSANESFREEQNGLTIVRLCGSPEELGHAHGDLLREEVRRAVVEIIDLGILPALARERGIPLAVFRKACYAQMRSFERQIPPHLLREIAALAEAAGLSYEQTLFGQVVLDVAEQAGLGHDSAYFHACTQVALMPERTGKGLMVARNLDWPPFGGVQELGVLFEIVPDQGQPFYSLGWAGSIGTLTAVNIAGLCVTEESLTVTADTSTQGIPTFLLHRLLVERSTTLDQALRILVQAPRTNGYHTLIASGREKRACVVEHSAHRFAVRTPRQGVMYGVETVRSATHYTDGRWPENGVPLTDETSDSRYLRFRELLDAHPASVRPCDLMSILGDTIDIRSGRPGTDLHCLANDTTLQSLVADLEAKRLFVATGNIPAPHGGFVEIDMERD